MAKTVPLQLRKPPKADATDVDAFVRAGGEAPKRSGAQTSRRSDAQASKAVVERADGRKLRRMTVYLPTELAARLRVHCAEADVDVSTFIAEMVAGKLGLET